jgi:protein-tyrosine phosphatase
MSALPRGGKKGFIEFPFSDGWTIFLTSANGAANFAKKDAEIFNVTLPKYYGAEYDMDKKIATRLEALAGELDLCHNNRKPVVIHCNHGRSRSAISLGVYLMLKGTRNLNGGYDYAGATKALENAFMVADEDGMAHYHEIGLRVKPALEAFSNLMS